MSVLGSNGRERRLHFSHPPRRVVSLVPSVTESLFELGCGEAVVGVTDYCVHPAERVAALPRVGGTKNPNIEAIAKLNPDLIIANQEENSREAIEALEAAGYKVWVTFPHSVKETLEVLWALAGIFRRPSAAMQLEFLEKAIEWARESARNLPRVRYFCPIWQGHTAKGTLWWMTFNSQTYTHDLLALFGGENVFAHRKRRYPLEADLGEVSPEDAGRRDTRYPRVTLEEVRTADPEVILLPSEPFHFEDSHRLQFYDLLPETRAVRQERVHLVDGSLLTWHGTRIGRALRALPPLFH